MLLALAVAVVVVWGSEATTAVGRLPVAAADAVPSVSLVVAAGAAAAGFFVGLAALHAAAAMRVLARDRRIPHAAVAGACRCARLVLDTAGTTVLGLDEEPDLPPTALPRPGRRDAASRLRLTVLVPAHDEALTIGATLSSPLGQTRPPDRVVVVADNCTDDTAEVARGIGVEVFETVGNTEKKAGAPQPGAGAHAARDASAHDVVMVMDADSTIAPEFLEVALGRLEADPDLIAVGGVFYGEDGGGLVGQFQRNEYTRYQRVLARRRGRVFVLTGTASVFRAYALRAVADARGPLLPGDRGQVYDTLALTEDNELTLALKTLGARMISPTQCRVDHRGDADLAGPVAAAAALAPRRAGEHRRLRPDPRDRGVLGPAARDRLRDRRAQVLPAADDDHPAGRRQLRLVWFWVGIGIDLRRRADRHRVGRPVGGPARSPCPSSSSSATTSSCRPSRHVARSTSPPAGPPAGTTSPAGAAASAPEDRA